MSERVEITASEIAPRARRGGAARLGPAAALVRLQVTSTSPASTIVETITLREDAAARCSRSSRPDSRPARTSSTSCRWRSAPARHRRAARRGDRAHRRVDRLRRARRSGRGSRAAAADRDQRRDHDGRRPLRLPPLRRRRAAPVRAERRAPDGRRAVELVARVRRPASCSRCSASSSPASTPSSRCCASSPGAASPTSRPLHGWYDYEGQRVRLDARRGADVPARRASAAGSSRSTRSGPRPRVFLERLGSLGTVTAQLHTVLASDAADPAFSPEEPSQEALSLLTATIDEDIERIFLRLPDDERARADRRPRPGRARAPRRARPDRRRRPGDPHPRRLPPRADPAHAARAG